jgi:transcription elongation factor Elf1
MSDRKYRQRGYQDDPPRSSGRPSIPRRPAEPRDPRIPRDPKAPNMPGFREVFRCSRCGHLESPEVATGTRCAKCGADLHTCSNCGSFDPGARFECREPLTARVSPKDRQNACPLFSPRVQVERETGSTPASGTSGARKAFDDLFKF